MLKRINEQQDRPSTLLNAGRNTNILYRVTGCRLTPEQVDEINSISAHKKRMAAIYKAGCRLEFDDIEDPTFRNNLLLIVVCLAWWESAYL